MEVKFDGFSYKYNEVILLNLFRPTTCLLPVNLRLSENILSPILAAL